MTVRDRRTGGRVGHVLREGLPAGLGSSTGSCPPPWSLASARPQSRSSHRAGRSLRTLLFCGTKERCGECTPEEPGHSALSKELYRHGTWGSGVPAPVTPAEGPPPTRCSLAKAQLRGWGATSYFRALTGVCPCDHQNCGGHTPPNLQPVFAPAMQCSPVSRHCAGGLGFPACRQPVMQHWTAVTQYPAPFAQRLQSQNNSEVATPHAHY